MHLPGRADHEALRAELQSWKATAYNPGYLPDLEERDVSKPRSLQCPANRLNKVGRRTLRCGRIVGHSGDHQATYNTGSTTTFWATPQDKPVDSG